MFLIHLFLPVSGTLHRWAQETHWRVPDDGKMQVVSVYIALASLLMRPIGGRLIHCQQRQPEVAHLHQDTMKCGLICKSTRQEGFPMREIGDGESIEPGRPV